jgi:hypothetical protein
MSISDIPEMFSNLTIKDTNYMEDNLTFELFQNKLNIYDEKNYMLELGVPNVYCSKYFDDEDFIYAKLKFSEDFKIDLDLNVINYISTYNIIIDFSEQTLDTHKIYSKILYIYQFVNSYYTSLSYQRPQERIKHMPCEFLQWINNIVNTLRYILDKDLFNFRPGINEIEEEYYNELLYGLNLTICHLKMILNHYRVLNIHIYNMEEKHIKKLFKVLNNMCIIMIFFREML